MAWEYVGGTSGAGTGATYAVSLTGLTGGIASAPAEGDLVVVLSGFGNTASSAPAISGNNSGAYLAATAAQHVNDTWDAEFRSFYRVAGATPDTSLTVTRVNNAAYGGGTVVQVWRGVDTASPFIGAATPASGGNGAALNPPSYDPAVADALVIGGGAGTMPAAGTAGYTAITGLSNIVTAYGNGTTADTSVIMGSALYAGSAIDPAVATGGTQNNTSSSWAGVTIAFRMAPGPITGDLLVQETGADTFAGDGSVEASEVTGDLVASEAGSDAWAGAGAIAVAGTFSVAETGSDTATLSGVVTVAGVLSTQEAGADTFAAVVVLPIAGLLAAQDGADTLAVSMVVFIAGSGITSESGGDAFAGSASTLGVPVEGSISAQETGPDLLAGAGVTAVAGSLAAQDGADGFTAAGAVSVAGTGITSESGSDAFSGAGLLAVAATLTSQEDGADTLVALGSLRLSGAVAAVEGGGDLATAAGAVAVVGTGTLLENGSDVFAGVGGELVLDPVVGDLAAVEEGLDAFMAQASVAIEVFMVAQEQGADLFAGATPVAAPLGEATRYYTRLAQAHMQMIAVGKGGQALLRIARRSRTRGM